MDENELLKKYNSLYLEIIMKYRGDIEEHESLYIAELPRLVTPQDGVVKGLADTILGRFPGYRYDDNFYDAAKAAFSHVRDAISTVSLPVQFWLSPAQTINYSAGDVFDKAVLLCSLLVAMGNASSKVMVAAGESERRILVYFELGNRVIALDLEKGSINEARDKNELLRSIGVRETTESDLSVYEFNDKMYVDIA